LYAFCILFSHRFEKAESSTQAKKSAGHQRGNMHRTIDSRAVSVRLRAKIKVVVGAGFEPAEA
jgi:hypothetical protein